MNIAEPLESVIEKIHLLQSRSEVLSISSSTRVSLMKSATAQMEAFLEGLPSGKAYHSVSNWNMELTIDELPKDFELLLDHLKTTIEQSGINAASGKHFGYIPGGGLYTGAIGDFMAAVMNAYAGMFFASPGAVHLENNLITWLCSLMGYPADAFGNLSSGGSIANLTAITTAREHFQIKASEFAQCVIYLSPQAHHCVHKALRIAGMGESIIRMVPIDSHFRMNANALTTLIMEDKSNGLKPFLIVGSAGTTDTGAVDPLDSLADAAEKYGLWFHVDAAYGGFFMLVDTLKPIFKGIERSDSLAIDPHKGLFLSYGLGAVLVKNKNAMLKAHYYKANYLQDAEDDRFEISPCDVSPELTKHFRGLRMWLSLQFFGLQPFRAALEEKIWLCRYFYSKIQTIGFEVGPYPDLSVMIFRFIPAYGDGNALNERILHFIHEDGSIFLSSTRIQGKFWIRLAVMSFRTHLAELQHCLEKLELAVKKVNV